MPWLSLETERVLSFNDRRSDSESEKSFLPTWQYLCLPGKPEPTLLFLDCADVCSPHPPLQSGKLGRLTSESIKKLECFQGEIAKRILQMPKQYSNKVACTALGFHSTCTIRKLKFLH